MSWNARKAIPMVLRDEALLRRDGSAKPARVHMRDPSFVNLQATGDMVRNHYIADFIATLAMMDPVLGGIDR